ncbi:hypothetical protein PUNSTDRAFT_141062 [Punctularia strigosozonata HHB-11173 SS5]|uniref:uncharacterized protein n=1 Tax=Punctularia strigosozonata (strain HHB-11173) TaxID=741275 RepID=UPI0004417C9D|nr:uncharacterized protein PUNSTDRAFT_141062 [Punctularia strigosozonata HHB-11173 SS5]EIN12309.1 hypothetical protein PUNSTDRAFT_141062 [Punctularia strigosozonata HHB-11173 SS5]
MPRLGPALRRSGGKIVPAILPTLDLTNPNDREIAKKWHVIAFDMRKTAKRYLHPGKKLASQDPDAVDRYIAKLCEQYPFFRRYDDAWPIRNYIGQHLENLVHENRHRQSARWRKTLLMRHVGYKQFDLGTPGPGPSKARRRKKRPAQDFIDLSMDTDDDDDDPVFARLQAQNATSSISAPPATSHERSAGPSSVGDTRESLFDTHLDRDPHLLSTARESDPIAAFLTNLEVSLLHLRVVLGKLGIEGRTQLDDLCGWEVDERNAWLDKQLRPQTLGVITPYELRVIKTAMTRRGRYLKDANKENEM